MSKQDKKNAKKATDLVDPTQAEIKQVTEVILELSKQAPAQVATYVKKGAPYLAMAYVYIMIAMPHIIKAVKMITAFVNSLPEKVLRASIGFAVCFFGGVFPMTIAAVEAWNLCGGEEAMKAIKLLKAEFDKVYAAHLEDEANKKDDEKTDPKELVVHNAQIVMKTVDPETVSQGIVGLYTGWIGVLAILKIQFAKTVTLGERIGEELYRYASKVEPHVCEMIPEEYRKWVPTSLRWICKAMAVTVAYWIQRVISAVHSAIRGGLMFGACLVDFLHERKIVNFDSDAGYLDETIGWGVALAGLFFQFSYGFGVPFPLNLLLMPLQFVEGFIVWSVASS